jgi:hypothetical protein
MKQRLGSRHTKKPNRLLQATQQQPKVVGQQHKEIQQHCPDASIGYTAVDIVLPYMHFGCTTSIQHKRISS